MTAIGISPPTPTWRKPALIRTNTIKCMGKERADIRQPSGGSSYRLRPPLVSRRLSRRGGGRHRSVRALCSTREGRGPPPDVGCSGRGSRLRSRVVPRGLSGRGGHGTGPVPTLAGSWEGRGPPLQRGLLLFASPTRRLGEVLPLQRPRNRTVAELATRAPSPAQPTPTFDSAQYWRDRYRAGGNSGAGSYGRLAGFKAEIVNAFVREHDIASRHRIRLWRRRPAHARGLSDLSRFRRGRREHRALPIQVCP